jgi:hypothetical protein
MSICQIEALIAFFFGKSLFSWVLNFLWNHKAVTLKAKASLREK